MLMFSFSCIDIKQIKVNEFVDIGLRTWEKLEKPCNYGIFYYSQGLSIKHSNIHSVQGNSGKDFCLYEIFCLVLRLKSNLNIERFSNGLGKCIASS